MTPMITAVAGLAAQDSDLRVRWRGWAVRRRIKRFIDDDGGSQPVGVVRGKPRTLGDVHAVDGPVLRVHHLQFHVLHPAGELEAALRPREPAGVGEAVPLNGGVQDLLGPRRIGGLRRWPGRSEC